MGTFMNFYLKKSLQNIKQQWLVILSIGISISLVAGLGYYIEGVYAYQFEDSFQYVQDMEISHLQSYGEGHSAIPLLEYSNNFQKENSQITQLLQNSGLNIKQICQYGMLSMEEGVWVHGDWEKVNVIDSTSEFDYKRKMNATEIEFVVFDEKFYSSDRFKEYFKIIEGQAPQNSHDILVEYRFAIQFGLEVGELTNITMLTGSDLDANPPMIDYGDFQLKNVNISGFYLATLNTYVIDTERFIYSYIYEDFLQGIPIKMSEGYFDEPAMFSYYNFTGPDMEHPFQLLYQEINDDPKFYQYLRGAYTRSGYLILYNREDLQFTQLFDTINLVQAQSYNLSLYLPMDHGFVDIMSFQLSIFYEEFRDSKAFIRLLYFPVLIIALVISIIFIRSFREDQITRLFYLKTLGIKDKTLKRQTLVEGTLKGFISSVIGLFLGLGIFYLYEYMFKGVFISDSSGKLLPYASLNTVLTSIGIGIFISILSIMQVIRTISKMYFEDLARHVNFEDYSAKYDEFVIYSTKKQLKENMNAVKNDQIPVSILQNGKVTNFSDELPQDSDDPIKEFKKLSFKDKFQNFWGKVQNLFSDNNIYEEQMDEFKAKISVKSWIFIGLGIIPIILYSLIGLSYIIHFPDTLIDIVNALERNMGFLQVLILSGIILIIMGLIRILIAEKPTIYAKWTKFLSRGFIKDLDKYLGVNLIGKAKWTTILTFLTIIFSLLISLNMINQSTNSYQNLAESLEIGADAKLYLRNPLVRSHEDILEYDQNLQNITYLENNELLNQSVFGYYNQNCHLSRTTSIGDLRQRTTVYTLPSEDYIEMLNSRDRIPPTPDFYRIFDDMHEFNQHNTNITGVIVTSYFRGLSSLRKGDQFELSYNYLTPQGENSIEINFQVEVIGVVDLIPGVYTSVQGDGINGIFIDFNEIVQPVNYIYGEEVFSLLNLNLNNYHGIDQQKNISKIFTEYAGSYCEYPVMSFYDLDWNTISRDDLSIVFGERGFYGIFYYDFILIGFFIVVEITIMAVLLLKDNEISDKRLIGRGMKKKIIKRMNFVEFFTIYLSALILGITIGIGVGSMFIKLNQIIEFNQMGSILPSSTSLPIFFGFQHIALIIGIYTAIAFIIFSIGNVLNLKTYSKAFEDKKATQQITPRN
ncbi:MAG: FtsX-like permease family protein [Promethearchaeota archaeon]